MTKGERIKLLREHINLSQTEMAEKIGVSKQTLYKYENDIITNVPSDKIEEIAKLTGASPAFIMGWEDSTRTNEGTIGILAMPLSNLEQQILKVFRTLPDNKKIALYEFVKTLAE